MESGRWRALAGAAVVLAGCASPDVKMPPPAEIGYLPPSSPPVEARTALVQQPPFLVWGNLVDLLQQTDDLVVTQLDEAAGYVVAIYSGDPQPYVNCGWIARYVRGGPDQIPAAAAQATIGRLVNLLPVRVDRDLRLDGRLMVQLAPDGAGTVIDARTTYVLTKIVEAQRADGTSRGRHRETISFETGQRGEFAKGTVCQPTGELERLVLDSLPATAAVAVRREHDVEFATGAEDAMMARVESTTASLACAELETQFGPAGNVRVAGYVNREQDAQQLLTELQQIAGIGAVESALEVQPWPLCEILLITRGYREANLDTGDPLQIAVADGHGALLQAGERLELEIDLPPESNYLYLVYVQQDGRIAHLANMPTTGAGDRVRYDTGFEVAEPFGREMILAIASEQRLFAAPRPDFEPPERFVYELREELSAAAREQTILVDHLTITTQAGAAGS